MNDTQASAPAPAPAPTPASANDNGAKGIFKSKTIWAALALAGASKANEVTDGRLCSDPEELSNLGFWGAIVFIVLRLMTKGPLSK